MARNKLHLHLLFLCFSSFLGFHFPLSQGRRIQEKEESKIKGMFVFGSSLVDNGNRYFLEHPLAEASYLPYGIDFPKGPSGRYNNGRTVIDLLGEYLKLPNLIPVFNDPSTKGSKIVHGVNFAHGGSGILDDTGPSKVASLNEQLRKFENVTLPELEMQIGNKTRRKFLADYLFIVGSGGNDYSAYFANDGSTKVEEFAANLTAQLSLQLKKLYNLGARKFLVISVYPTGCSPGAKNHFPSTGACIESIDESIDVYNIKLRNLVGSIKQVMPGANLVFLNAFKIVKDIVTSPTDRGFSETSKPCCEIGPVDAECTRGGSACANRSSYVYFDNVHPTEAVNKVLASKAFASNLKSEVYPINIKQLSKIPT